MRLKYGNYLHANGEVALNITKSTIFGPDQIPQSIQESWIIEGKLLPTETQSVNSLVAGLSDAYSYDGLDLALLDVDGSSTSLYLNSRDCTGGTQVTMHPSFPTSRDAALITNMPYKIVVRGSIPIISSGRNGYIVSWRETVQRSGGGPKFAFTETLYGRPIPQRLRRYTTFHTTQVGSAVGRFSYPIIPPPIWPSALVEAPNIIELSPKRRAQGDYENYEVQWRYRFESAIPLIGGPTII